MRALQVPHANAGTYANIFQAQPILLALLGAVGHVAFAPPHDPLRGIAELGWSRHVDLATNSDAEHAFELPAHAFQSIIEQLQARL